MALKVVQTRKPDVILLDVMMPDMDGFETCQRLKADETTRHIPVIFMTALTSEDDKVKGFEVGAVDYVTKPIQQREVLARVTTHLRLMASLHEQEQQRKISDSLRNISKILNSTLDQKQLLQVIMEQLGRVIPFDGASIFLHEHEQLVLSQGIGFAATYLGNTVLMTDNSSNVMVFNSQKPMLIADTKHDERWQAWGESDPIASWLGAPLVIEEEAIGVLTVDSFTANKYSEADVAILQIFANHAAGAIRNAHLYSLTQQVNEQLVKLNADKDKFFSIVAHDLKGPFLPLLGNLELMGEMAETLKPKDVQDMSAAAHRSAKRVFELLENLLHWARLQMGRMEYHPQAVNLHNVAQQTVNVLGDVAAMKGIRLLNEVAAEVMVHGDRNMLDTVIRNLTNNALKFTPKGGQVTIKSDELGVMSDELKNTPNSSLITHHFVQVSVADTGVGMHDEMRQKLFKLDEQVTTLGTAKEAGTGLGLIICQEMVAKSGGQIWVESEVGKGTTVKFTVQADESN
jgi:signal transduction histidine kinase/CheY-like chemotaxis protein